MLRRFPAQRVERFCGRCCPEVQLLLKAQTGFDVSFLVCWMGTVGREKEPSILRQTAWPCTWLTLHQNNQSLACQPGWEGEGELGMWLVCDASSTLWIPKDRHDWESGKECKTAAEKKKNAAAFVVKEDFLYCQTARAPVISSNVLPESGKIWKINHHIKKPLKN